jgi:hypothetical protein
MTIFTVVVVTLIATYLGLICYLIWYLRGMHTAMWIDLGRPWINTPNPFNLIAQLRFLRMMLVTAAFLLLTFQYRTLNDTQVSKLIWTIRTLLVIIGFLFPIHWLLVTGRPIPYYVL